MSALDFGTAVVPESTFNGSLPDDELCHIVDSNDRSYCGYVIYEPPHGEFGGEAVCPVCGRPTCPRCAQLYSLDDALEDML